MGRVFLSVCAVVLALGLGGLSPPQGKAGEKAGEASQPQQSAPQPIATPKADDPERLYAACRQGQADRNSDLCAQWYAADSAYDASIWARRTGWFTGLGLIVGAITMAAAICAALFAKEAANHTRDGAKAAAMAVNRPWIKLTVLEFGPMVIGGNQIGQREITGAVKYELECSGDAPAARVMAFPRFAAQSALDSGLSQGLAVQTVLDDLRGNRMKNPTFGRVMFPGDKHIETWEFGVEKGDLPEGPFFLFLGVGVSYDYGAVSSETVEGFTVVNLDSEKLAFDRTPKFITAERLQLQELRSNHVT